MSNKVKKYICLGLNILNIIFEIIALIINFTSSNVVYNFRYYTQDSNYFLLIASIVYTIYLILDIYKGKAIPKFVKIFKFTATCLVSVTFIVVLTILGPMMSNIYWYLLFGGAMLFQHTLCPIVAIILLLLFEDYSDLPKQTPLYSLAPTLLYGLIILPLNIFHVLVGPYPFLHIYEQPVYMSILWILIIGGGAYGYALLCFTLNKKIFIKRKAIE